MTSLAQEPDTTREAERWRVRKGDGELACIAVYLPTGIDPRIEDDFRRTLLVRDANRDQLVDPERIKPGMVLKIP